MTIPKTYDNPIVISYTIPAADMSTDATELQIVGPPGLEGKLLGIEGVLTVATTTAASELTVGTAANDDAFGILAIPVALINTIHNAPTIFTNDALRMAADTRVVIASDGGAAAGTLAVIVTIGWF